MIEIIDSSSQNKMLAMVIANVKYMDDNYVIYGVDRGNGEANIFVSKLVVMSEGYTFNHEFENGDKELLDRLVKRIINKDNIENDGFVISNDIVLGELNYFDVNKCYVATVSKKMIKEFALSLNYGPEPDTISFLVKQGATITEVQADMEERIEGESYLTLGRSITYMVRMLTSILFIQNFRKRKSR